MDINKILDEARRLGCSDLHFTAGLPPVVRLHGSIKKLSGYPDCTEPIIVNIINQITSMKHKASIQKGLDTDFSYVSASGHRHRVNVYRQRGYHAIAMRLLRNDIPTLQDGHIVVDENGVPTGMLHERARHLVYDILTKYTKGQLKQFILDYQKDLLSTGLTTVQTDDFKLWDATIDDILAAYEELDKEGKLNVRFIQQLRLITDAQLDAMEADNRGCAEALDKHDVGAYFRHLDEFNGLLTQSSNMPLLIKLLDQIESYSATTSFQNPEHARFRESVLSDDERRRALAEHEEIVASLRARDADRLRRVLTAHTANVHEAALQRYGKED